MSETRHDGNWTRRELEQRYRATLIHRTALENELEDERAKMVQLRLELVKAACDLRQQSPEPAGVNAKLRRPAPAKQVARAKRVPCA